VKRNLSVFVIGVFFLFFLFFGFDCPPIFFHSKGHNCIRAWSWIISRKKTKKQSALRRMRARVNTHPKRLEESKARRRDAVVFLEEDNTLFCVPFLQSVVYIKDNEFP